MGNGVRDGFAKNLDRDAIQLVSADSDHDDIGSNFVEDARRRLPNLHRERPADGVTLVLGCAAFGWSQQVAERFIEQGLAIRERTEIRLTIAGALYLLVDPSQELGKSYIEVFRFRDDS
jgi:hypothetical protein